jgi:hypothetical protein
MTSRHLYALVVGMIGLGVASYALLRRKRRSKVPCEPALHEAAHVIMFDALGMEAGQVCCVPPDANFGGGGRFQLHGHISELAVGIPGALAGEVASLLLGGKRLNDAELNTDWQYFRDLTDEERGGRSASNFIRDLEPLRTGWVRDWIDRYREVIIRLAAQIEAEGYLEGNDLQCAIKKAWGRFAKPDAETMKSTAKGEVRKLGIPA